MSKMSFDGATAQEIIDFAKSLPDEYMDVKKILVQTAFKKISHPHEDEEKSLYHDQMAYMVNMLHDCGDPCDV